MIKLKDIAQRSGYSINTVSRALKNKSDISERTRKLIQQTAKEMGYIQDSVASSLRSGTTNTIAVILGDISNPHFAIIVKEIETLMRRHGYYTFILNTEENAALEGEAIRAAAQKKVDGIILCPVQDSGGEENIAFLRKIEIPFVLIGRYFRSIKTDYVVCDDFEGGYLATSYLFGLGHTRIGFLNVKSRISSAVERFDGYREALKAHGIEYDESLYGELSIMSGGRLDELRSFFAGQPHFTALFAFSDMIAWEAAAAMGEMGLVVPGDVSIVGFDNIQSKLNFPFPLTSIRSSKSQMSIEAVDLLVDKIANPGKRGYTQRVLPTGVVERGSCQRL